MFLFIVSFKQLVFLTSLCFVLTILSTSVLCCKLSYSCEGSYSCAAFSESSEVFIARLTKTEAEQNLQRRITVAFFEVDTAYKGAPPSIETLRFKNSECAPLFKIGETYLVYKEPAEIQSLQNRTDLLVNLRNDEMYLKGVLSGNLARTITGLITGIPRSERSKAKITFQNKDEKKELTPDEFGRFSFSAKNKGEYIVTITFPFRADFEVRQGPLILTDNVKTTQTKDQTTLCYKVTLDTDICDFREIGVILHQD